MYLFLLKGHAGVFMKNSLFRLNRGIRTILKIEEEFGQFFEALL